MHNKSVKTNKAPSAIGPYSQGVIAGNLVFISGQLAINPETGTIIDGSIAKQTQQIMRNIKAIAEEAGSGLEQIVKTTIFLTDLNDFQEVNGAYGAFFVNEAPARATVQVAALPLGACVEIEAIGCIA